MLGSNVILKCNRPKATVSIVFFLFCIVFDILDKLGEFNLRHWRLLKVFSVSLIHSRLFGVMVVTADC